MIGGINESAADFFRTFHAGNRFPNDSAHALLQAELRPAAENFLCEIFADSVDLRKLHSLEFRGRVDGDARGETMLDQRLVPAELTRRRNPHVAMRLGA